METPKPKRAVDIEQLVRWAYREELPKRKLRLEGEGATHGYSLGGGGHHRDVASDRGHSDGEPFESEATYQRYAKVEPPHVDATLVESAVTWLSTCQPIDWSWFRSTCMADLIGLTPERDIFAATYVTSISGGATTLVWRDPDAQALAKDGSSRFGASNCNRPARQRAFSPQSLVVVHACAGTRPLWDVGRPRPMAVMGANNRVQIVGECKDRNRYTGGAYCPLAYGGTSIDSIALARAEFTVWRSGLDALYERLRYATLVDHALEPMSEPDAPWLQGVRLGGRVTIPTPSNDNGN